MDPHLSLIDPHEGEVSRAVIWQIIRSQGERYKGSPASFEIIGDFKRRPAEDRTKRLDYTLLTVNSFHACDSPSRQLSSEGLRPRLT